MRNPEPHITGRSKQLFIEYAKDAGNWSGSPLVGGNVPDTKEDRGNLTQLKRAGLIRTEVDEGNIWLIFTEKGKEYAKQLGFNSAYWNPLKNILIVRPPAEERRRRYTELTMAGIPSAVARGLRDYRPTKYRLMAPQAMRYWSGREMALAEAPKYRWWKNPIRRRVKKTSWLGIAAVALGGYLVWKLLRQ